MSTLAIHPGMTRPRSSGRRRPLSVAPMVAPVPARLTRRGRLVIVLLVLGVLLATLTVFGSRSAATGEAGVPVRTRTVEVGVGDTMWGIAAGVAAPGQVRETVHQIEELNALSGPSLSVGQRIAVPVG